MARGRDRLEATAREVEELGGAALVLPLDVADAEAVDDAAEQIEEHFGPIDIWVNNAMATVFAPVRDIDTGGIPASDGGHLPRLRVGDAGRPAADAGTRPRDDRPSRLGARLPLDSPPGGVLRRQAAIRGFTESLRTELLHDGSEVHVTMVELPAHNTPQFGWSRAKLPRKPQPVPPIFQPEVAAEAILYAATHRRRELVVGWPAVKAVYGEKVAPGLLDHYLARSGYDAQQTEEPLEGERRGKSFRAGARRLRRPRTVPRPREAPQLAVRARPSSRRSIAAVIGLGAAAAALLSREWKGLSEFPAGQGPVGGAQSGLAIRRPLRRERARRRRPDQPPRRSCSSAALARTRRSATPRTRLALRPYGRSSRAH